MPGTASTQNTDRDRLRSRSVPRASATTATASLQSPILFRLPAILPVPVASVPDSKQTVNSPIAEVTAASSFAIETVGSAKSSTETLVLPSPSVITPTNEPTEAEGAASKFISAVPTRTWWEHWSSGVVLILLIVALVAASIIALNDGGKAKPDHLAGESEKSMVDEFDLSSISIPEITVPASSETANIALASITPDTPDITVPSNSVDPLSSDAARAIGAVVAAPPEIVAEEATGGGMPQLDRQSEVPAPLATLNAPVGVRPPRLFASDDLSNGVGRGVPGTETNSLSASNSSVTLELPSALSPSELSPSEPSAGQSALSPTILSPTILSPTITAPINRTANSGDSYLPATNGASPAFYDGAANMQQQTEVASKAASLNPSPITGSSNSPEIGGASTAKGPVDTNMPSLSTILASTTDNASAGVTDNKPVFATASHQQPANQPAVPPASLALPDANATSLSPYSSQYVGQRTDSHVVPSATPDLNGDSIVNEYLKFDQMRKAISGEPQNRFANTLPPSTQTTQGNVGTPPPVSASPPMGTGFTLGNPQVGSTIAPPLPQ